MEELKLNCIHEMYTSTILNQQIQYYVLEEKYNNLLGNNYVTEEVEQKKQSIFKRTIKRWIGKLITFITKTIPNWIKKQVEKISNILKRRKNVKVLNTKTYQRNGKKKLKNLLILLMLL